MKQSFFFCFSLCILLSTSIMGQEPFTGGSFSLHRTSPISPHAPTPQPLPYTQAVIPQQPSTNLSWMGGYIMGHITGVFTALFVLWIAPKILQPLKVKKVKADKTKKFDDFLEKNGQGQLEIYQNSYLQPNAPANNI